MNTAFFISPAYEVPPIRMMRRLKSIAMTVSLRTPWRFGSALNDGSDRMVKSGT